PRLRHVLHALRDRAFAVARRILDLRTNFARRLALPRHRDRREMPMLVARDHAGVEVLFAMTGLASHQDGAEASVTTRDGRLVLPPGGAFALHRTVPGRMAIHAAFVREHLARLDEDRGGS